ncbi:MAG: hypothetical protein LBR36_06545 [Bacteroidales bacterium]|jgi:hypothetical protein|nr:hypothetical protein [Bacteroidales bacterium]
MRNIIQTFINTCKRALENQLNSTNFGEAVVATLKNRQPLHNCLIIKHLPPPQCTDYQAVTCILSLPLQGRRQRCCIHIGTKRHHAISTQKYEFKSTKHGWR